MTRTLIDIDDEKLEAAKRALGTSTKVETVNRALAEVAREEGAPRVPRRPRPGRRRSRRSRGDPRCLAVMAASTWLTSRRSNSAATARMRATCWRCSSARARLATCHVIALEVLYSARNLADYETLRADISALPWLPVTVDAMDRGARSAARVSLGAVSTACRFPI